MKCKICGCDNCKIIWNDVIRDGALDHYTDQEVILYQCNECGVIWHDLLERDLSHYYETETYRMSLEGTVNENDFYSMHDRETLDKLKYTGTGIFRNKIVADIGSGCGSFLDFIIGVASEVVAIEPSKPYREVMKKKRFNVYPYASEAINDYECKVDVITSFDVIEHVESPEQFLSDIHNLLAQDGLAVIGTPTDAPVMRELLGDIYEKQLLFSTQHLWIFNEKSLKMISEKVGFSSVSFKYYQRYGVSNLLGWVRDKKPKSNIVSDFTVGYLNSAWKSMCAEKGLSDYIVVYLKK